MRRGNLTLFNAAATRSVMADAAKVEASLVPMQAPEPVRPFDALALPALMQAAMLMMHESQVKRSLIAKLLEDSQDTPSSLDFRNLRNLGLCEWKVGKRLHDLTAIGIASVKELERKLCIKLDVHCMTERGRSGSFEVRFACPCGFSTLVRASGTAPGNAAVRHHTFIKTQQRMASLVDAMTAPMKCEVG